MSEIKYSSEEIAPQIAARPERNEPYHVHFEWIKSTAEILLKIQKTTDPLLFETDGLFSEIFTFFPFDKWTAFKHIRTRVNAISNIPAATLEWRRVSEVADDILKNKIDLFLSLGPFDFTWTKTTQYKWIAENASWWRSDIPRLKLFADNPDFQDSILNTIHKIPKFVDVVLAELPKEVTNSLHAILDGWNPHLTPEKVKLLLDELEVIEREARRMTLAAPPAPPPNPAKANQQTPMENAGQTGGEGKGKNGEDELPPAPPAANPATTNQKTPDAPANTLVKGEWSTPMSKAEMANRLGNMSVIKAETFLKQHELKQAGNRQLWTVRLDTMPKNIREKLEGR